MSFRFHPRLMLSGKERAVLRASLIPYAVERCVHDIENATNHAPVSKSAIRLALLLVGCRQTNIIELMQTFGFKIAIERHDKFIECYLN